MAGGAPRATATRAGAVRPDGDECERLRAGMRYALRGLESSSHYARELELALDEYEEEQERAKPVLDAAELEWLRSRNATLEAVEAGGWWRLRRRLLPLIRLAGRLRRGRQ